MTALNETAPITAAKDEDFFQEKEATKPSAPDRVKPTEPTAKAEPKRESEVLTKAQLTKALEQSNIRIFDAMKDLAAQIDSLMSVNGQLLKANALLVKEVGALKETQDFKIATRPSRRKKRVVTKKAKRTKKKIGVSFKSVFKSFKKRSTNGAKQLFRLIRKRLKKTKLPILY